MELGDAAMIVDCDVTSMEQAVDGGRLETARALAAGIAPRLVAAEPEVVIAHERTLGRLELLEGDPAGVDRMEAALAAARDHGSRTPCTCASTPSSRPASRRDRRAERDDLRRSSGSVRRDSRNGRHRHRRRGQVQVARRLSR